jgi:cell division protein FtsL
MVIATLAVFAIFMASRFISMYGDASDMSEAISRGQENQAAQQRLINEATAWQKLLRGIDKAFRGDK